jgi:RimJ/RimL family protein N-acetyltransferase
VEQTERLHYEPLDHRHADGLFVALNDERVGRYINGPDVTTVEALHDRIDRVSGGGPPSRPHEHWVNVVVRRIDDGVIVGRLEATVVHRRAEIAYVFGPVWWGHGYATEATAWLVGHLCEVFDLDEIGAAIHPDNSASQRLVQRIGLVEIEPPEVPLTSYDPGDLVFMMDLRG